MLFKHLADEWFDGHDYGDQTGGPELLLWKVLHGAGGAGRWGEPGAGEAFQV